MNKKILVIDDEKDILIILKVILEDAGYLVTTASCADEALDILKKEQPRGEMKDPEVGFPVVLSDIMMPKMNGIELLHIIKKDFPDTMVIMLTAHMSMESAIKSLNEGAFAYLTKPVDITELKVVLRHAYEKYNLIWENRKLVEELNKAKKYSDAVIKDMVYTIIATDTNGFIRKINKAMEGLLGYTEEEIVGSPIQSIFAQGFHETKLQEMAQEGRVKDFPIVFLTKESKELNLLFSGTVMKDEYGQVVGFLGTVKGQ